MSGVASGAFDLTFTAFGAMFAPEPHAVAAEMTRVTRRGGRIVMANWIPNDPTSFISQVLRISADFAPPPAAAGPSPMMWGVAENIFERFAQAGVPRGRIELERDGFTFRDRSGGPEEFIESLRRYYGPTMNAYEAAEATGRAEQLHGRLLELAREHNRGEANQTTIAATYLRVTVRC